MGRRGAFGWLSLALGCSLWVIGCKAPNQLKRENELQARRIVELENRIRELEDAQDRLVKAGGDAEDLRAKLAALEKEKEALKTRTTDMARELTDEGVAVDVRHGNIVVTLASKVFFDSGKAMLRTDSKKTLRKVGEILVTDFRGQQIRVDGHTDDEPIKKSKFGSNWDLSAARSMSVLEFLVDQCKVDPKKIYFAGFGEWQPVANNRTAVGRQSNRRVEIVILPPRNE